MAPQYKRKRLWIDPPFQSRLLLRAAGYLFAYAFVFWHVSFFIELIGSMATDGLRDGVGSLYLAVLWKQRALLLALVVTGPMFLYDMLKFSHRIAGPLYRCRNVMQEMADGHRVPEFVPRENDLMKELFATFNNLVKVWNSRVADPAPPAAANGAEKTPADNHTSEPEPVNT
jgi:hypothetical protein